MWYVTMETRMLRKVSITHVWTSLFFPACLQVERDDVLVLLVGGGSVLVDQNMSLSGASRVITPEKYSVSVCVAVTGFKLSGRHSTYRWDCTEMGGHTGTVSKWLRGADSIL